MSRYLKRLSILTTFFSLVYAVHAEPPNIILIIADDMNWDDCGAYGHPNIKTPNIDQLAEDGLRFERAYLTASSCSPSRASIITGLYPHNTGAEQLHWAIPPGKTTFVQALKAGGYFTAAAGKWHMGQHIRDHFEVIHEANKAGFQLPTGTEENPPKMIASEPSGCEHWITTLQARPKDRPFFMWLAALDPHREYDEGVILDSPHLLTDVVVPPYLPNIPAVREDLRKYYDEIGRLDAYVGEVVAELDAQGISENTVIIFMSDNGRPFPRDKTTLYEGGIKTPFLVKWPKVVAPRSITKSLISAIDIAPTILDMAEVPVPSSFEGLSFIKTLKDPEWETRKFAYAEDHWHDYEDHGRAVFTHEWKLIRNDYYDLAGTPSADVGRSPTYKAMKEWQQQNRLNDAQLATFRKPRPPYELYNLVNDPNELHNLAYDSAYIEIRDQFIERHHQWSKASNDYLPTKRTPDEFDRLTGEPDHSVRKRPRPDKKAMFGTYGKY